MDLERLQFGDGLTTGVSLDVSDKNATSISLSSSGGYQDRDMGLERLQIENAFLKRELREKQKYILSLEKALKGDAEKKALKRELRECQMELLSLEGQLVIELSNCYDMQEQLDAYVYGLEFDL